MAALRALGEAQGFQWTWKSLADITLNLEQIHLGIIAGRIDQWIKAQNKFLWINFTGEKPEVLAVEILPSLRILIPSKLSLPSGSVHVPIIESCNQGDTHVKRVMDSYRTLVE